MLGKQLAGPGVSKYWFRVGLGEVLSRKVEKCAGEENAWGDTGRGGVKDLWGLPRMLKVSLGFQTTGRVCKGC